MTPFKRGFVGWYVRIDSGGFPVNIIYNEYVGEHPGCYLPDSVFERYDSQEKCVERVKNIKKDLLKQINKLLRKNTKK